MLTEVGDRADSGQRHCGVRRLDGRDYDRGGDQGVATFRTSAEAYDRHIGRYGPALARALVEATNVSAGQQALDVGCGPGALTAVPRHGRSRW